MMQGQEKSAESQKMFAALDKNGDGFIDQEDLRELLFQLGVGRDVVAVFRSADQDGDGLIRIEDFVTWLLEDAPAGTSRRLTGNKKAHSKADSPEPGPQGRQETLNCSQWFANAISEAGVTHVYGGHGGALVPMVNAVVEHPHLTWIPTRNEANASLMAAAHAKLTGALACCIATSGPGATNLTTGLMEADLDQCSVIAITGLKPRQGLGYSEFQDVDQARLFAGGGIAFSQNVASSEAFVPLLRNAVATALAQRTCAHLAVPVDVQAAECPVPFAPLTVVETLAQIRSRPVDTEMIDSVVTELHEAMANDHGRVLIAIGHRCVDSGPEILALAEKLHAPVLTRLDAKGCCDESHPLVWGVMGVHGKPGLEASARLIEKAELVLAFGVHDFTILLCNTAGLQVRPMIQFEPDVGSVYQTNAQYQAIHTVIGYTPLVVKAVLKKLKVLAPEEAPKRGNTPSRLKTWRMTMDESMRKELLSNRNRLMKKGEETDYWELIHKARRRGSWAEIRSSKDFIAGRFEVQETGEFKYCHPMKVFEEMNRHLGPNDVLCVDTGDVTLWASLCAVLTQGQRTLSSERLGTMGYSLCAGLAACLVREEHGRAVVVAGDGGIQMTINELGTVRQVFGSSSIPYKLVIIVFDNAMLGRVCFGFSGAKGCDLGPSPDFVGLIRSYGGEGVLLEDPDDAPDVLAQAFASNGLFLIHALVDPRIKADMTAFKDKSIQMMASG